MAKKSKKQRKEKEKRVAFIRKISKDGKISKKEGQKAANKGISLQAIQNRNIGDYRDAGRAFDNRDPEVHNPRNRTGTRPTFEPLKIKRGAYNALTTARTAAPAATPAPAATETNPATSETAPVKTEPTAQELFEEYKAGLPDYGAQLQTMEDNFGTQISGLMNAIKGYDDKFVQQQQNYQQQMTDMRQTLTAQMNPATRNPIFGVRATPQGVGQRIMRDSFGRRGDRIRGIRNTTLNVS